MKSLPVVVLLVALALPGCMPCEDTPGCIPRGGFCHPGNWHNCCCRRGCLGLLIGFCYASNRRFNGLVTYVIKDASNNSLLEEMVPVNYQNVNSKDKLDKLVARLGNQELYMDANIEYYDAAKLKQVHKSVRGYKIN